MRKKIAEAYRWFVNRLPEVLLTLFVVSLAPLVYLVGRALAGQWRLMMVDPEVYFGALKSDPWPLVSALFCIVCGAAVAFVVLRWRSLIWAVARKMIIEALHRRVVVVLLVFVLVLMPFFPFVLKTEGSLKSQVQIVFTYALTLAEVLLSMLAVFLATASICGEVERRQVHITDSKPLRRWQFLVGKLLGIVVMCCALLFVMAGAALAAVGPVFYLFERDLAGLEEWEVQQQKGQRQKVFDEVFVARSSVKPPLPDVSAAVEEELKQLAQAGELQKMGGPEQARERLKLHFLYRAMSVPPGVGRPWVIHGLKPPQERDRGVEVRRHEFTIEGSAAGERVDSYLASRLSDYSPAIIKRLIDEKAITVNDRPVDASYPLRKGDRVVCRVPVKTDWIYIRFRFFAPGAGDLVRGRWETWKKPSEEEAGGGEKSTTKPFPVYRVRGHSRPGAYQELRFPADAVNEDGTLYLTYANLEPQHTVTFALEDGLEILQETEGFLPNYYRSLVVIMFHIVLLAALGLMAGSVFSFPVASLLVVFIFGLGVGGPWFMALMRSVSQAIRIEGYPNFSALLNWLLDSFLRLVFKVVPHFGKYSPLENLVTGRLVAWPFVAEVAAMMVFIKGGVATLIGVFFYSRRELARIIA